MTAVITYARAFSSGIRHAAKPHIADASEGETQMHDYVLEVRNKFLAHSVNGFEDVQAVAFLTASPPSEPAITGIGHVHSTLSRMDRASADAFRNLCRRYTKALRGEIQSVHVAITQELLTLGPDAVYALPDHVTVNIDQTAVGKRRK